MNLGLYRRRTFLFLLTLCICLISFSGCSQVSARTQAGAGKTVRLLAIGNSFSGNATRYLHDMAAAGGQNLIFAHASIGGCSLEKHVGLARLHDKEPASDDGKPYQLNGGTKASLQELLCMEKWDYVTIQQSSGNSYKIETFRPFARQLVNYIRQYAPQAKILVHETWSYREDDVLFSDAKTLNQWTMFTQLHYNYALIADEVSAAGILPVGSAFQNAISDSQWKMEFADKAAAQTATYPELPVQKHTLHGGYYWNTNSNPPSLRFDGHHAGPAGEYLGGAVWYEYLFGDVRGNSFVPQRVSAEDVKILQRIAHETVAECKLPRGL